MGVDEQFARLLRASGVAEVLGEENVVAGEPEIFKALDGVVSGLSTRNDRDAP
ncbi:hypothetical protein [Thermoactinospora rubra]|uniref:hypothetical protein n=1 Tax=Thermoactinospora rubra TaxID=1088767 RepID=UPI00197D1028|nr:hypothetical protein [Thermoactinospora rubra]